MNSSTNEFILLDSLYNLSTLNLKWDILRKCTASDFAILLGCGINDKYHINVYV